MRKFLIFSFIILSTIVVSGCSFPKSGDNVMVVPVPISEPAWIRSGEPIQFEGENWYPTDEVENLMDNELDEAGTYRDVTFFLAKTDVKPFDRIYTRFAKGRYRAFEKRE
jgi:hypothetical protein